MPFKSAYEPNPPQPLRQNGPRWSQDGAKTESRWPKMESRWPKMEPRWQKMGTRWHKMAQDGAKLMHKGAKMVQGLHDDESGARRRSKEDGEATKQGPKTYISIKKIKLPINRFSGPILCNM